MLPRFSRSAGLARVALPVALAALWWPGSACVAGEKIEFSTPSDSMGAEHRPVEERDNTVARPLQNPGPELLPDPMLGSTAVTVYIPDRHSKSRDKTDSRDPRDPRDSNSRESRMRDLIDSADPTSDRYSSFDSDMSGTSGGNTNTVRPIAIDHWDSISSISKRFGDSRESSGDSDEVRNSENSSKTGRASQASKGQTLDDWYQQEQVDKDAKAGKDDTAEEAWRGALGAQAAAANGTSMADADGGQSSSSWWTRNDRLQASRDDYNDYYTKQLDATTDASMGPGRDAGGSDWTRTESSGGDYSDGWSFSGFGDAVMGSSDSIAARYGNADADADTASTPAASAWSPPVMHAAPVAPVMAPYAPSVLPFPKRPGSLY